MLIQTNNLENTFRALRSQNPQFLENQIVPSHKDYKDIPRQNYAPTTSTQAFGSSGMYRFGAAATGGGGVVYGQPQFFSPVHTPINWQIPSKRLEQYQWARFFYENEPKIAASIDFYSYFPMNDYEHECKNRDVRLYFDKFKKRLELSKWTRLMSHEVHLLGDCFPFIEIDCPHCFPDGTMVLTNNGHKNIKDIEVDDLVLTFSGEYCPVIKTMSFKYNGDMVEIKRQSLPSIKSTSDHKHYIVRPEYREDNRVKNADWCNPISVEAKDIKIGDYLATPFSDILPTDVEKITYDGSKYIYKNKNLAKKIEIQLDSGFASLMGWYVAEGSTDSNRTFHFSLNCEQEELIGEKIKIWLEDYFNQGSEVKEFWTRNVRQVVGYSRELSGWFDEHCGHSSVNKKIPSFIMRANKDIKESFLKSYLDGDGCSRKSRNENTLSTISKTLCFDLVALLSDLGYSCYVDEKEECIDNLGIHRCHSYRVNYRIDEKRKNGQGTHKEKNMAFFKVKDVTLSKEDTTVYNMTVDKDHSYVANYCYTKNCGGSGRLGDEICDHQGGTARRVVILNPDYVEVFSSSMSPDPVIALKPDEELMAMVQGKMPGSERLTPEVRRLIAAGQPIRLDNRSVTHMKYGEGGYNKYGTGMVRRLFPILSYKTKLMVAQWIVAERLIVPIKIVKVGSDERPAGPADIAAVQEQLAQTANDPNLTIVTHHAFDLQWEGASGKVLTLSNEFEFINQEILDGMMINNALLNGEGPTYNNAAIGIESMIERLETFRREISQWIEEYIYLPEAMRQGFVDRDPETGVEEFIYPKVKWNSMHLRDQQQYRQSVLQLYEKGLLSAQTVLEVFDFDPDTEIERKRYDAVQMMALGQGAGGGEMGGGFGGGDMGMGGGDMGMGGGDMGMGGGGEMGGGEMGGGDMGMGGGGGGGAAMASTNKRVITANVKEKEVAILEAKLSRARAELKQAVATDLTKNPISMNDLIESEVQKLSMSEQRRLIEIWKEAFEKEPSSPEKYVQSMRYEANRKLESLVSMETEEVKENVIKLAQNTNINLGEYGGKVLTKKTREKMDAEKKKMTTQKDKNIQSPNGSFGSRDEKGRIIFTKPEREIMDGIIAYKKNGLIRYAVVPQLDLHYGGREYPVDFGIPALKIAIEADGEMFHSSDEQVQSDNKRDAKLAQLGWTVLRFKDSEISKSIERVMQTIVKTIMQKEMALNKVKQEVKKT